MDTLDALESAYRHAQTIFDSVSDDQRDSSTPCLAWDVQTLIGHTLDVMDMITVGIGGAGADTRSDRLGEAFGEATARSLAAWRGVDSMDRAVTMPWGESTAATTANMQLADVLAHTWDLAVATNQNRTLPEGPAAAALDFTKGMLQPSYRSDAPDATFGLEVPVAADAPLTDRLVGWLGRDPSS